MTRTLLSVLAAGAVLAVLTDAPADALQLKKRSGASPGHSMPKGSQQFGNAQRPPSAVIPSSALLAVRVWRAKCRESLLPPGPGSGC
jgi:hypothetical protein